MLGGSVRAGQKLLRSASSQPALTGLIFVEALPTPQLSIPIALAAAIVCAHRPSVPG